jgi:hypothetical protein
MMRDTGSPWLRRDELVKHAMRRDRPSSLSGSATRSVWLMPGCVLKQQPGIAPPARNACLNQPVTATPQQRFRPFQAASSSPVAASSFAWWSATSASMTSSRPSPAMI